MYPILFSIWKINVYTHGVFIALGSIFGGIVIYFLAKKASLKTNFIFDLIVFSIIGGLIGARLLYVIVYFHSFRNITEIFYIWYGGLISYGGIIGGLLVAALYLRVKKENILKWFDLGVVGLSIGWVFGRIGCFLSGDSFGLVSNSSLAIWGRLPTQLFESFWSLMIAVICYFGLNIQKKRNLPDGLIFALGIGLYSLGRFVIDFWRDEPFYLWHLKAGQLGSLVIIIAIAIWISYLFKKERSAHGF